MTSLWLLPTITALVHIFLMPRSAADDVVAPCALNQSIILSSEQKLENGSYAVQDAIIPPHLTFTVTDETTQSSTVRGCICLVKMCLPWCCDNLNGHMRDLKCTEIDQSNVMSDIKMKLEVANNTFMEPELDLMSYFFMQTSRKIECASGFSQPLRILETPRHKWHIHANGSLHISILNRREAYLPQNEYCFAAYSFVRPTLLNSSGFNSTIGPHICVVDSSRNSFFGYSLIVALPFMFITIIVYLAIPKLRNLHGKALVCYLSCMSFSYLCMAYILLVPQREKNFSICIPIGYACYFSSMSGYFWLSAISFQLWFGFTQTYRNGAFNSLRFSHYCQVCFGSAIIYAVAAFVVQKSTASDSVKPGIGKDHCYLNVADGYSAVIWLYLPLIIVITFNCVMFTLIWRKIRSVTVEVKGVMNKQNNSQNTQNDRNEFHIFLRLFVIMGVSWAFEIASYLGGRRWQDVFIFLDFLNAMQGVLIFILFVLKKQTRKLIAERLKRPNKNTSSVFWIQNSQSNSNKESGTEMTPINSELDRPDLANENRYTNLRTQ